jgi:hypothetical protein
MALEIAIIGLFPLCYRKQIWLDAIVENVRDPNSEAQNSQRVTTPLFRERFGLNRINIPAEGK